MSRYNHFAPSPYERVMFDSLPVGAEFRVHKKHSFAVAVKTGELSYTEKRSKKEHKLFHTKNFEVYKLEKSLTPEP